MMKSQPALSVQSVSSIETYSVRRWTDISGAVHRGVSVRRLKIGFICVHYFFVLLFLLLLLIQGDDVNRRGVSGPRRGAAFCFSALLCKMAAINPHNDKGAQNGNPEIKDSLIIHAACKQ